VVNGSFYLIDPLWLTGISSGETANHAGRLVLTGPKGREPLTKTVLSSDGSSIAIDGCNSPKDVLLHQKNSSIS